LGKGCPAKNAVGAENPSVAAILNQPGKWVEAESRENANNWIIGRKSS
jgi:hypothetical protein